MYSTIYEASSALATALAAVTVMVWSWYELTMPVIS